MASQAEVFRRTLRRNLLNNPEFQVDQRVGPFTSASTPVNNDDTYLLDQWTLLAEGADSVDASSVTTGLPTGALAGARAKIRLDIETANLKFGIIQFVEAAEAREIIGGVASLSFKAQQTGTSISSCRAAILAWSSTADSLTSDVVSSWDATDAGVTLVANWTLEGSLTFTPTTSWVEYRLENVAIDTASAANVAVFIWCDDTTSTTVGEFLEITDVNLVAGPVATPIHRRSFDEEERRCQRFLCKTFPRGTSPATASGTQLGMLLYKAAVTGATANGVSWRFPVRMRVAPAVTYYNPGSADSNWWNSTDAGNSGASSSAHIGDSAVLAMNAQVAGDAAGETIGIHASATAEL